jgi:hypothetical protein
MIDLESRDFEIIGTKILGWYETREALVRPVLGTIYLYRRTLGDEFDITQEIVFFNVEKAPTDLEAYITPKDFNLPIDFAARNLPLPLKELKEEFPRAVKKQSQKVAEARAIKLLKMHGLLRDDDSDYQPSSPGSADKQTLPPVQDPSKPGTQSRKHGREEELEKLSQSQKKRKPGKTQTDFTDQDSSFSQKDSFTRTASSSDELCFNLDSDDSEDDPEDNPAFSFSAPPATQSSMSTDPHSSTGVRKSSRRKGKASSGGKI